MSKHNRERRQRRREENAIKDLQAKEDQRHTEPPALLKQEPALVPERRLFLADGSPAPRAS